MAAVRFIICWILIGIGSGTLWAQVNRYMVFFHDKQGTPYTLNVPEAYLSQRALERRFINEVSITSPDLPVNPAYVQVLRDAGINVLYTTRWMNGVLCTLDAGELAAVEGLAPVERVEFVAPGAVPVSGRIKAIKGTASFPEVTAVQLGMLGLDVMHEQGDFGEGVIVAILDDGFMGVDTTSPFAHIIGEGRLSALSYDFVGNSGNIFRYDDHGTEVLSVVGAYQEGTFTGGAYKATFQLYVTEDAHSEYRVEEYNWLFAAERADSAGVDIIQTSLGYNLFDSPSMNYTKADLDGMTTVITRAAKLASDRGIIVICSAGNEGNNPWQLVTPPADGRDVLAVGNVYQNGIRNLSSSIGPTADGRIKPDLMALGSGTALIRFDGMAVIGSGTSFAAPMVTSLMTGLRARYPSIKSLDLIDAVKKSASNAATPNNQYGYGIPHFQAAVNYFEREGFEEAIIVYPNPLSDTLTIVPRDPATRVKLELLDALGRPLEGDTIIFNWVGDRFVADLSSRAAGFYILRATLPEGVYSFRLVVSR